MIKKFLARKSFIRKEKDIEIVETFQYLPDILEHMYTQNFPVI